MNDIFDLGLSHQPSKPPLYRRFLQLPAIGLSLAVFAAIAFGGVTLAGKYLSPPESNDYAGDGTGIVQVEVRPGDTSADIAKTLVTAGVVKTQTAFIEAAQDNPSSRDIQPGRYQLRLRMSAASALALLLEPSALVGGKVTIPEGTRLSRIKTIIEAGTSIKAADLDRVLNDPAQLGLPDYAGGKVEGFLFPATYNVTNSTTASSLVGQMVAKFNQTATAVALADGAKQLGVSPYDVVKVASLIEAEVKRPQDYPQVAEVIYNRLHRGMKLQLDSTVNYAMGTSKPFLSQSDLLTQSHYNTYVYKGLPPTPIDSPGKAALEAALHPTQGKMLYFVTVDQVTGETRFTDSDSQFEAWRIEAQRNATAAPSAGLSSPASGSATP